MCFHQQPGNSAIGYAQQNRRPSRCSRTAETSAGGPGDSHKYSEGLIRGNIHQHPDLQIRATEQRDEQKAGVRNRLPPLRYNAALPHDRFIRQFRELQDRVERSQLVGAPFPPTEFTERIHEPGGRIGILVLHLDVSYA